MRHGIVFKGFTCFVCLLFFLFTGGFFPLHAEGTAGTLSMGRMISRGSVEFKFGEKAWAKADPASFPIFPAMTIKTEKGTAAISFGDRNQIEVGPKSILAFERKDQIRLSEGSIEFRISPHKGLNFCAGKLIVVASLPLQAGKISPPVSGIEQVLGSLTVHPGGAVTIQANQGHLRVLSQERIVMAVISSKESLTIPSAIAEKDSEGMNSREKIAQVGEEEPAASKEGKEEPGPERVKKSEGLSTGSWVAIGLGALALGGLVAAAAGGGGGGGSSSPPPACP
ncbi:MAG: hypothetical protein H6Q43_608 [Deltaproteobacteria bacterium]|jgi:hypothetical protein|nr:hypothetical protein [Deltaproteobacteria bacterium]